ncbi:MAG: MGMT family protein [Dokdonella sp.]
MKFLSAKSPASCAANARDAAASAIAAIERVLALIPLGCVVSYGEVAARAGLPRRARMVGKVLRDAPDGSNLPWFRVVRADGRIALPPRSAGFREQTRRLRAEGVPVVRGRIDLTRYGWDRDVDAMLWGPRAPLPSARKR